ncbi:hypothetical protein HPDFL43_00041690 [Hoeflea phototrophica DFL-43]|uniref:Uncharacterized protein n=1 Tax=Hoeflea phototrophica (strain DSM 17068 / NCIMB 14078 / DFL-43) TaxID=411684 RepID=A0A094Z257_HOEPD|nr:hypothetical protein HPDFL43_00041690 [Hoeflea phototrophica DFL-43]
MNDAQNYDGITIDAEIDTAFAVGEGSQSWTYPITGHTRESGFGNPLDLRVEVGHKPGGNADVLVGEIDKNLCQVVLRFRREN